jgi:hypothetical protein
MRTCSKLVLISCLLVTSLALGCISGEKSMNVSVDMLEKTLETEAVDGGLKVMVRVVTRATNVGDPGNIDVFVQVFDEIDDKFLEDKERIHLDKDESKDVTIELEKIAPEDSDVESFHISSFSTNPTPD